MEGFESREMTPEELRGTVGGMTFLAVAASASKIMQGRASRNRAKVRNDWLASNATTSKSFGGGGGCAGGRCQIG